MPELKRIPQAGIMNTDFNVRILPPDQYREALNVNVGRSETSEVGTVENVLGNLEIYNTGLTDARCIGTYRDNSLERIYFFVTTNDSPNEVNQGDHRIIMYDQIADRTRVLADSSVLNFHFNFPITGINLLEDLLFWTDNRNEPRKINVDRAISDPTYYSSDLLMAVAKVAPILAPTITEAINDTTITSTFLQDKLPRFSYRWQFEDGEYSVLAPFTPIVFNGSSSLTSADVINAGEAYDFVNDVNSISVSVPVEVDSGITSVELIYKDTGSNTVYIIDDKPVAGEQSIGFDYRSQDPFRAIPNSQITRVADAVPRVALAQEVAGNRIVYGNYLQNYNLPNLDFIAGTAAAGSNPRLANHAVKSRRTYQLGLVLSDRYGRTTPVILSDNGGDTTFVDTVSEQLTLNFTAEAATALQGSDFHSYKIVVKQREQEYYNWYTQDASGTAVGLLRNGDSVNKVPIDTTEFVTDGATARPSSRSVYVGDDLRSITIDNTTGLANIVGENTSGAGFTVYEVEPVSSNLDIFYETSTGGLVADIQAGTTITVEFYNCYVTPIGGTTVETSRIREGFNEPFFDLGVRAHIVNEDFAGEERRSNALIHSSGLFNSRTGLNQLNQFNEAEGGITLSLDPADGSIQKLYAEDTQITIWQEDKISRSPIDKDFIYSAEGGAVPVTSNTQYLGTIAPYPGEYGISTDPQSFAVYGETKYFTDRNRGVVLSLSQQGLREINKSGMNDFFRDALRTSNQIIGSFDEYHNHYNLTIVGDGYSRQEDTNRATASDGYFTLSYEQDVNGWVSFKSFKQETGTTLNNTYYTFSGGDLYQHHVESQPRNNFYGNPGNSYIDFVFNDSPSLVKDFKTIGYEGQGDEWRCDYIETDLTTIGEAPQVNTNFTEVALMIDFADGALNAPNTRFSGERNNIVELDVNGNGQAKWVVVVSPISTQFELETGDVTLVDPSGNAVISPLFNDDNGLAYFEVTYDVTVSSPGLNLVLGGIGASLVFQTTLLVINVLNGITNTELVGTVARSFTNVDTDESEVIDIIGVGDYYIEPAGVTVDTSNFPLDEADNHIILDTSTNANGYVITTESDNPSGVRITLDITTPSTPFGVINLPLSGDALLAPELSWMTTGSNVVNSIFTNVDTKRVVPRDIVSRVASVTGEVLDLTIETITTLDVAPFPSDNVSSHTINYDEGAGTYAGTFTSSIATVDTQSNIDLSRIVVNDANFIPAIDFFEFNLDGTGITTTSTTYNTNLSSASTWATNTTTSDQIYALVANGVINVTAMPITEIGEAGQGSLVDIDITSDYARLTGLTETIQVLQRGRVYHGVPTSVTGGDADEFEVEVFFANDSVNQLMLPTDIDDTGGIVHSSGSFVGGDPYGILTIPFTNNGAGGTIFFTIVDGDADPYVFTITIDPIS